MKRESSFSMKSLYPAASLYIFRLDFSAASPLPMSSAVNDVMSMNEKTTKQITIRASRCPFLNNSTCKSINDGGAFKNPNFLSDSTNWWW